MLSARHIRDLGSSMDTGLSPENEVLDQTRALNHKGIKKRTSRFVLAYGSGVEQRENWAD